MTDTTRAALLQGEALTAWEVMQDVADCKVMIGNNPLANLLARRRAERLIRKIGNTLGEMSGVKHHMGGAEVVIEDPKDCRLLRSAVQLEFTYRFEFAEQVGDLADNPRWHQKSMALEGLQLALGGEQVVEALD